MHAPPIVNDVLRSPGQPLEAKTRAYMEPRFGFDFSQVRVHTGPNAAQSAAAVDAEGYAVGRHVVLGDRWSPDTGAGKGLVAHELAHTIQQRSVSDADTPLPLGASDDSAERDARQMTESAASARPVSQRRSYGRQLMRAARPFLLTFDDGPDGVNKLGGGSNRTEKVLDTLCDRGVQAAFFVQTAAEQRGKPFRGSSPVGETLIKRMAADGHMVGIHTGGTIDHESHPSAEKAGRLTGELKGAKSAIAKLTNRTPALVRPPFGSSNKAVRAVYKKLGLTNVLWDIDGDHSRRKGKAASLADIKANITADLQHVITRGWTGSTPLAPSIVALFHDIRPNTANNVGPIIDFIQSETSALTNGKDTAVFPQISCTASAGADEPADVEMPSRQGTTPNATQGGGTTGPSEQEDVS
jgi:peptidoglycan/xylan/chitin deacetylase (PgdA/CDA1 family)